MTTVTILIAASGAYAWCRATLVRARISSDIAKALEAQARAAKLYADACERDMNARRQLARAQAIYHEVLPETYEQ